MSDELRALAHDLKDFLLKQHRVTNVRGPEPLAMATSKPGADEWRNWEIRFTHRGIPRHYVYHVQRVDPMGTMFQALRTETNGELLVRIPEDQSATALVANTLYYPPHG